MSRPGAGAPSDQRPGGVSARTIQVALGLLWVADGLLQLQPKMFGPSFVTGVLDPAAQGQPGFVAWPVTHMAHLVSLHPAAWNATFAAVQLLIGLGLLVRQTLKPALVISFAWALVVWGLGEGFGMLFTTMASPLTGAPGAVLLYAVLGALVWPRRSSPRRPLETGSSAVAAGPLGERGARVVWAALWSAMAALWLLPANRGPGSSAQAVAGAAAGQPGWLSGPENALAHALGGHGTEVAVLLAVASVVIGWGPVCTRRVVPFLVAGVAVSLDFWVFGQALGGIFTGLGTDPNAAPLFIVFALALFPNRAPAGAPPDPGAAPNPVPPIPGRDPATGTLLPL